MSDYTLRFKDKYQNEVVQKMMEEYNYTSVMQVPRLEKICINQGLGDAVADKKIIDAAVNDLSLITGQKAVVTKARLSISGKMICSVIPKE